MAYHSVFSVCLAVGVLFLVTASAQVQSLSPPAKVVRDRAEEVKLKDDASPCEMACAHIASQLPDLSFLGRTGDFDMWDAKQSDLVPACRVEPSSAQDVELIMRIVVDLSCPFAIKGGGHARSPGHSNIADGVTIDLVRMNTIQLSEDRRSVEIGAGARWFDVYSTLEPEGISVVGGRVADIGVGGLTLGGGISFYSGRYGWACDNVISYNIVLPDATSMNVNAKSHPDLYFALRGAGSSNFGVITSFEYETLPVSNGGGIWHMAKVFNMDKVPQILEQKHKLYTQSLEKDYDVGVLDVINYFQPYDTWMYLTLRYHTTHLSLDSWPEIHAPIKDIEGIPDTTKVVIKPYSNITMDLAANSPHGDRNIYSTFCFSPSIEFETRIIEIFQEEIAKVKDVVDFLPNMVMQPISRQTISLMGKNGGNALGLEASDGPLVLLATAIKWADATDDGRAQGANYQFLARAESLAKEMRVWHRFKYVNYADESQDIWTGYGPENHQRLKDIQRAVDPRGIFTKGGLGGGTYFKLNEKAESSVVDRNGHGMKSEL